MILTCSIIDDEPLAVDLLETYTNKTPFLDLKTSYNSAIDALSDLNSAPVDLLFLDIQMPELNGMEFARMISENTRIIFTTAFQQYALDSYKVNALDYLLKPISYPDFLMSAQKALQWYEMVNQSKGANRTEKKELETIFVKANRKLIQIELEKILYIEGLKDYVKIYIEGQSTPIVSLMSMKTVEEMLPESRFIRIHRSFIVQPEKIKEIDRNRIVYGKEYIPISENYKERFVEFLSRHSLLLDKSSS
ncbi:LytTR family DNA-binding domain-containing protein [Bacteroidales bacterium OttesenSCG-928-M11]|nr:LytTR family DNA-binding domain-containing protein [Bacteroidales bacterium OttesenSCG-928-M11]